MQFFAYQIGWYRLQVLTIAKKSRLHVATQALSLLIESTFDCHRSRLRFRSYSLSYSSQDVQGL